MIFGERKWCLGVRLVRILRSFPAHTHTHGSNPIFSVCQTFVGVRSVCMSLFCRFYPLVCGGVFIFFLFCLLLMLTTCVCACVSFTQPLRFLCATPLRPPSPCWIIFFNYALDSCFSSFLRSTCVCVFYRFFLVYECRVCVCQQPPSTSLFGSHLPYDFTTHTRSHCYENESQKLMSRLWNCLRKKNPYLLKRREFCFCLCFIPPPPSCRSYVYFVKRVFKKDEFHSKTPYSLILFGFQSGADLEGGG